MLVSVLPFARNRRERFGLGLICVDGFGRWSLFAEYYNVSLMCGCASVNVVGLACETLRGFQDCFMYMCDTILISGSTCLVLDCCTLEDYGNCKTVSFIRPL